MVVVLPVFVYTISNLFGSGAFSGKTHLDRTPLAIGYVYLLTRHHRKCLIAGKPPQPLEQKRPQTEVLKRSAAGLGRLSVAEDMYAQQ